MASKTSLTPICPTSISLQNLLAVAPLFVKIAVPLPYRLELISSIAWQIGFGLQTMLQRDLVESVHCHHTEDGAKDFLRVSFHAWVHP